MVPQAAMLEDNNAAKEQRKTEMTVTGTVKAGLADTVKLARAGRASAAAHKHFGL